MRDRSALVMPYCTALAFDALLRGRIRHTVSRSCKTCTTPVALHIALVFFLFIIVAIWIGAGVRGLGQSKDIAIMSTQWPRLAAGVPRSLHMQRVLTDRAFAQPREVIARRRQTRQHNHSSGTDLRVPKIMYTFWDNQEPPPFVERCISAMRCLNPQWKIVVLSEAPYTEGLDRLPFAQIHADWARLEALANTGGVWMDATCICNTKCEAWVDLAESEMQGFEHPLGVVMETWAFACRAHCPLMRAWRDEFQRAIAVGFDAYKQEHSKESVGHIYDTMPYMTLNAAWKVASQRVKATPVLRPSVSENGPFQYLDEVNWNSLKASVRLCLLTETRAPFWKTRSMERECMEKLIGQGLYVDEGVLGNSLQLERAEHKSEAQILAELELINRIAALREKASPSPDAMAPEESRERDEFSTK